MRNGHRLTAIILAALLLASTCISCSNKPADTPNDTQNEITAAVESESETVAETTLLDTIPSQNLDGMTIKAITRGNIWWQLSNLSTENLDGEIINDAIYNRNKKLEEKLNISFEVNEDFADYNELASRIRTVIRANDAEYDIMIPFLNQAAQFAQEDYFINLKTVTTLDLSNPAWDQNANKYFDIENKLYFGVSDITLAKNEATWVYMFNKRIAKDFSLDNPYDLVRSGKWTFEKSVELMKTVTHDADGNSIMDSNDVYGLATHGANYYALLISGGEPLADKNENNDIVLSAGSERFVNVYNRICELFSGEKHTTVEGNMEMFMGGKAFICGQVLGCVRLFREMEDDFGLIPLPKYDEEQESYYSYVIPYDIAASVIPVTAKDAEISGTVLQTLAVLSAHYLTPAYYDVTITGKGLRDEDSAEMLDIIRASATYDLARMFDWGGLASMVTEQIPQDKPFVSLFEKLEKKTIQALEKILENFAKTTH